MSPSEAYAAWEIAFDAAGSTASIVRDGVSYACRIKPVAMPLRSAELEGPLDSLQTRRRFKILNDGLGGIELPLRPTLDRITVDGRSMVVAIVDDQTHRIGDVLIGIEIEAVGA